MNASGDCVPSKVLKQPSANFWNLEVDGLIEAPMKKPETERYECPFWPTLSTTPLHEYVVLNTDLDNLITATGLMDLDVLLRNLPPDLGNQPCTRVSFFPVA